MNWRGGRPHRTLFAVAVLASGGVSLPAAPGSIHTVTIENMQFTPARLSVHPGDRVVWVNRDLFPHTVSAGGKAFDSGQIAAGSSWTYVAKKPGEYRYSCTLHPTMQGTLVVK